MIRLHVLCEGQSEESFTKALLYDPPLPARHCMYTSALIGTPISCILCV